MQKKLSIRSKLFLIVTCLTIPILFFGAVIVHALFQDRLDIKNKVAGLDVLRALEGSMTAAALSVLDEGVQNRALASGFSSNAVAENCFPEDVSELRQNPRSVRAFARCVAQESGLLADADSLNTSLSDVIVTHVPELFVRTSSMMGSAQTIADKDALNPFDRMSFLVSAGGFKSLADQISSLSNAIAETHPVRAAALSEAGEAYRAANGFYQGRSAGVAGTLNMAKTGDELSLSDMQKGYRDLIGAGSRFYIAAIEVLDASLRQRLFSTSTNLALAFAFLIVTVGFAIGASMLTARQIIKRISNLDARIRCLADEADSGSNIPEAAYSDEIGKIARAVTHYRDRTIDLIEEKAKQEQAAIRARSERVNALITSFDGRISSLLSDVDASMGNMRTAAIALNDIALEGDERAGSAQSLSNVTARNVKSVADASIELSKAVTLISEQANAAQRVVTETGTQATQAHDEITTLSEAATAIGGIVTLIEAIAEQTNLLALNATIEAARAGEHGKGFAVVAHEVKTLATQTANATSQVVEQVNAIQSHTKDVRRVIESIQTSMGNVTEFTQSMTGALATNQQTTSDISLNVHEAAQAASEVSSDMAAVRSAAEQTRGAAHSVDAGVTTASQSTQTLREEVQSFLKNVASA